MKKKVLHIINGLELGGSETALYRLLENTSDDEFHVVVLNGPGYYSPKIQELGIAIDHLNLHRKKIVKDLAQLIAIIKKVKPDIVQTWLYHSDLMGGLSAKFCGVKKIIWSVRCEGRGLKPSTQRVKMLCSLMSWFVPDHILFNSKLSAKHHIRRGYSSKKSVIIYNGFDAECFFPNKSTFLFDNFPKKLRDVGPVSNAVFIGTLARFHKDKDYFTLINAIDAVCRIHQNAYFVLCGHGCHQQNAQLQSMLASLDYQQRVILIDGVDDSAAYLNQLDVFVLSSKTESFPNCLAEAMLCGLACIATDVGEVRTMLSDAGIIIPREDPQQLVKACLSLLEMTADARMRLGLKARNRIKACYSRMNHQQKMDAIYHSN